MKDGTNRIDRTGEEDHRRSRGQSLVELAFLLPLLLWLAAGIVDFGRVYQYNIAAINAARAGARVATEVWYSDAPVVAAVQADIAGKLPADANVTITVSPTGATPRNAGDTVTVTVGYTFKPITPLIDRMFPGGELTTSRTASMVVF